MVVYFSPTEGFHLRWEDRKIFSSRGFWEGFNAKFIRKLISDFNADAPAPMEFNAIAGQAFRHGDNPRQGRRCLAMVEGALSRCRKKNARILHLVVEVFARKIHLAHLVCYSGDYRLLERGISEPASKQFQCLGNFRCRRWQLLVRTFLEWRLLPA